MSKKPRLTKTRFKIGSECAAKLFYQDRKEYANTKSDDAFMIALAEGGFQVGELAKVYYPGGYSIDTLDYEKSVAATDELLQQKDVIIYEAAFAFKNLFVRVDVLKKTGNAVQLIEVKAKSFDSSEPFEPFDGRSLKAGKYKLKSDYASYITDIAFQTYVAGLAKPNFNFLPSLLMADKSKVATVDGLNQVFLISKVEGRTKVKVKDPLPDLGEKILSLLDLKEVVPLVIERGIMDGDLPFKDLVKVLDQAVQGDTRMSVPVGSHCKGCEFRISAKRITEGRKSGFVECWTSETSLKSQELNSEFVFDVWDYRSADKSIETEKYFAKDLTEEDLKVKPREDKHSGLSRTERQLLQVIFAKSGDRKPHVETIALRAEIKKLQFPIHFIDFETTMVAIPFHANRRPYEQNAFQFSHHILRADGTVAHRTEYLDTRKGVFPNYDFVRALKEALGTDNGAVLRFAAHENTVLNQIRSQLLNSKEPDQKELVKWIESLTTPSGKEQSPWAPSRQFVDMRDFVLRYCYLPETRGSNSIKKVLPAVLAHVSDRVRNKYSDWIVRDMNGKIQDPYKLLPSLFEGFTESELEKVELWLTDRDELNDGGAAMIAWARMQFSEISPTEHKALREALLRYCKLDTLAMVIIFEWWLDQVNLAAKSDVA